MRIFRIQNIPFKIKLFLSVGSIFLTIALIVCFLFSKTSLQNAMENDRTASEMILERISTQIDSLYSQMDIAATSITKNPLLKTTILVLNTLEENTHKQYIELIQKERTIQTALSNMMFSPIISNVLLYNQEEHYFYYSGTYFNNMDYVYEKLASDLIFKQFKTRPVIYQPPMQNPWTSEGRIVLSVLRNFSDTKTTQNTIVEIQVPFQHLIDICTQDSFQDEKEIMILGPNNKIVYPHGSKISILNQKLISSIQKQIAAGKGQYYGTSYSYSSMQSNTTDFTVVLLSNNRTVQQQIKVYILTAMIAAVVTLAVTLRIIFSLISLVAKPLNELISYVNKLSLDSETKLCIPSDTFNEFEILSNSMEQMVTKLKASIHENYELQIRESNANLAALQAQVDPHFLCNALNSISAASEIYNSEITTKMCQELSSMMRYVTSKKTVVTLIEEFTHTRNYLEFMKISNDTNFDYTWEIPQELHNLLIPKLSIQPFAENSFRHGFRNTMPPWLFSLVCHTAQNNWEIIITDNGGGFSEEALSHISTAPVHANELEINGLGLNNTFSRLHLYYGNDFSFQIENLSRGCQITLKGVYKHD